MVIRSRIYLPLLAAVLVLGGCYTFKGGSVPAHLHTILIPQVEDVSGFGRSTVRQDLTQQIIRKFRDDNSLRITDAADADARLEVTITAIRTNERLNVSSDDRETGRAVVVQAKATFMDNIKRRPVFEGQSFRGESSYSISEGVAGETTAITDALDKLAADILLETVARW